MTQSVTYRGKPCPWGHDGTRYRSNMACVECARHWQKAHYNREESNAKKRAYRARKAIQQKGE